MLLRKDGQIVRGYVNLFLREENYGWHTIDYAGKQAGSISNPLGPRMAANLLYHN